MSATEDRVKELFRKHMDVDRDPDFDLGLGDSGVSSMEAVKFVKKVGEAFNVVMHPEDVAKFQSLRDVVKFIDTHAG